ncbi:MAG: response regulator [Leptospiraceae bacterium]|nr:response regulator [Leptospiraceae bacterium]MCP5494024.1 response regulator [Leptospiraceae bacterium]
MTEKTEYDILIVDQDRFILERMESILQDYGYKTLTAVNIGNAMEQLLFYNPRIAILEIFVPIEQFKNILRTLQKIRNDSVIIVYTDNPENKNLLDAKVFRIFDILIKPASPGELLTTIKNAIDFSEERKKVFEVALESEERLKEQLEWMVWKEHRKSTTKTSAGKYLVENIKHSIFQGLGLGVLITLIDLMSIGSKEESGYYAVPSNIFKDLIKNGDNARKLMDKLDTISGAFDIDYESEKITDMEIREIIHKTIDKAEKFRKIKNQKIVTDGLNFKRPIKFNKHLLDVTLTELLTNSFKYSPTESTIYISKFHSDEFQSIMIMNSIMVMKGRIEGIPREYENAIFEPFYRLNRIHDERFFEEELGFGIGLTVIHNSLNQLGSQIHLYEVLDHSSSSKPERKVVAEIKIPFFK